MAAATGARKSFSINDYPEHLNPFREDDNHNKIKFWTLGKRLSRSNSINFSGIKDLKNSWAFRSFMKKGKRGHQSSTQENKADEVNGDSSPIVYRRALQYSSASMSGGRSTLGSPEHADRYVYGGSVTPLPRSRFQERLRCSSQQEVSSLSSPRMARSEVSGSRLSVESHNPFEDGAPVPPVRASRRKKKRAPPPPPGTSAGAADVSMSSETSELTITENVEKTNTDGDLDIDETLNLNVELKIVEDEDIEVKHEAAVSQAPTASKKEAVEVSVRHEPIDNNGIELRVKSASEIDKRTENIPETADSEDDILNAVSFSRVDIVKYRRNSSVNDDDIRLRRGNLEDFHELSTKRSKSLTNALDSSYVTYDINLNENKNSNENSIDKNGNEEPKKVICKLHNETARKQSIDNSISSTEKEFMEIDKVRREFEREINKLNAALVEDDFSVPGTRVSVSDMKRKFDKPDISSPNPIPKPRRSHYGEPGSPVNGNFQAQIPFSN